MLSNKWKNDTGMMKSVLHVKSPCFGKICISNLEKMFSVLYWSCLINFINHNDVLMRTNHTVQVICSDFSLPLTLRASLEEILH